MYVHLSFLGTRIPLPEKDIAIEPMVVISDLILHVLFDLF